MSTPHPFRFGVTLFGAPSRQEWIAKVHKVEDLGYSVLQVPDHLGNQFSPILALMAAAEASRTLRLGTLVLDINYRHLALLVKEVATLDLLSEGRFELGLGAGWIARESQMTGIPFDPAGQRVGRLEEAVHLLKGLFSAGPMTFAGRYYSINGFEAFPKPFQHPHPPLLLSGGGKRMLSIAGSFADIVTLNPPVAPDGNSIDMAEATAEATTQQITWIREAAGDRFAQIELGNFVIGGVKTQREQRLDPRIAAAFRSRTTGEQQSPQGIYTLVGSVDQICEHVLANRERFGLSYISVLEQDLETFAPIVARLSGK
ncbi:MAG TPA: TIGR03621 family F420-dependent LLM class oxidoreductase [Ktedonobacteraceae bacterium]|nr:TIGR03621 family F420-dependent LLM class oxidoreductase [Ktedonobacteraceae bacterium]